MNTKSVHQLASLQIPGLDRALQLYVHASNETVSNRMLELGEWEPNETLAMQLLLSGGEFVIDVGANIGYYTLLASRLVGPKGHVLALEPDNLNFSLLAKNCDEFGNENIELLKAAASSAEEGGKLYRSKDNFGDHRIFPTVSEEAGEPINTVTLDSLVANLGIRPDLVKIDCQGAETQILQGMTKILGNVDLRPKALLVEYWPYALTQSGSSASEMLATLPVSEYAIWNISPWNMPPFKTNCESLLALAEKEVSPETKPYTLFTNLLLINQRETELLAKAAKSFT